jgi:probable phosphoglycerate mutase
MAAKKTLRPLLVLRHGATALNLAGLRCGGDVDAPLADPGHRQAREAASLLRAQALPIEVIVTSGLQRTRQTADIVARSLPRAELIVEPALDERRLGQWNRRPIAETQADLAAGITPPGGESSADFARRIRDAAVATLVPLLERRVLLIGSKGVARVLGGLAGAPAAAPLGNAELIELDLSAFAASLRRSSMECTA